MKYKKIVKPEPTLPMRKTCGDCYYNGFCNKPIKECKYLEDPKKSTEERKNG